MRFLLLSALVILAAACSGVDNNGAEPAGPSETSPVEAAGAEPVALPISLYIVVSESDPQLSSSRSVAEVEAIGARVTEIWAEAGVVIEIGFVGQIDVPPEVIQTLATPDGRAFLQAAGDRRFAVPEPGAIVGFYTRNAGGVNGFAPFGQRAFFVTDEPSVFDERVSSHEIGHILGLHHELGDSGRLMFSGTNGMELTSEEATVARYAAEGIMAGAR